MTSIRQPGQRLSVHASRPALAVFPEHKPSPGPHPVGPQGWGLGPGNPRVLGEHHTLQSCCSSVRVTLGALFHATYSVFM